MRTIALLLLAMLSATTCFAADPPPTPKSKPASSLDDELFQGLDDATTAPGVKPKTTAPTPKPQTPTEKSDKKDSSTTQPPDKPSKPKIIDPLDAELLRQLEGDAGSPPKTKKAPTSPGDAPSGDDEKPSSSDPFQRLSEQIRRAEARLAGTDPGEKTQQLQREIVDDLEKLIAQIEQQQQQKQQSQSKSQKPSSARPQPGPPQQKPQPGQERDSDQARDSTQGTRSRQQQKPDPNRMKSLLEKAWGMLPERERQDVMQSSVDDFPSKYQYVIEEYFKTLLKRQE